MKFFTRMLLQSLQRQRKPLDCGCPEKSNAVATKAPEIAVETPLAYTVPDEWVDLWVKLSAFPIDKPGVEDPLSKRLARERKWTHAYALRVVEEYRKFIFLCVTAGHMCTPSVHVDEAWHLHLLYTKSYWDKMCKEILGRPIHHQPSDGGTSEENKYAGLYERTLDSYAAVFGEPPVDIWGRRGKKCGGK